MHLPQLRKIQPNRVTLFRAQFGSSATSMPAANVNAWAALEKGAKLTKWQYSPDPLRDNDVEIEVKYNGLCHTDIHMRDNDWGVTKFPLVPGHEVVGVVKSKGSLVTHLRVGDIVGVGWIRDSCRHCSACLDGRDNECLPGYTPTLPRGGFADRIQVPADFAFKLPEGLDPAVAGPLLCAGITVYTPLREHVHHPGTKVAVWGMGGLGHLAVQFAKAMGCDVTVVSTSSDKEKEASEFGAQHFVSWKDADGVKALSGTQELILNTVPYDLKDWSPAMSMLQTGGVFCFLGVPSSQISVPIIPLVFGHKKIVGSIVGGRRYTAEMLNFCATQKVRPLVQKMPLSKVNEAIDVVLANKARYRVVLEADW